mmetsp:Transcript_9855/g.36094  ORF Transcript_9855/g.36094 Transcript_9855/m.36094 type:complete len:95 (+) Transcript_9855:1079-1363(+)
MAWLPLLAFGHPHETKGTKHGGKKLRVGEEESVWDVLRCTMKWQWPLVWFLSKGLWLVSAYCLEFLGMSVFVQVWSCSLLYVFVDVLCMRAWLR